MWCVRCVGRLTVETIEWMDRKYKIWWSTQNGWNIKKGGSVDLVHPMNGFRSIPCLTFQRLLIKHFRKQRMKGTLDIFDWEEGYIQRLRGDDAKS